RRHRYSRPELDELNASYARDPRPSREERERLARFCNVAVGQIQIWFQNRRAKDRRY
ncbi:Homeodomain-like protein, partial [Fennellomyces sp. T-0311]